MSTPLREYDVVSAVRLHTLVREFDGMDSVKQAPRVGDEVTICHHCDPNDPRAAVAVAMIDQSGLTVSFADFVPGELKLIIRHTT